MCSRVFTGGECLQPVSIYLADGGMAKGIETIEVAATDTPHPLAYTYLSGRTDSHRGVPNEVIGA